MSLVIVGGNERMKKDYIQLAKNRGYKAKVVLNMTNDNIGRIVDNAYYQNISDLDDLDVRLDKFDKVSINDVKKVAEKTSISTIYVLEGGNTNE